MKAQMDKLMLDSKVFPFVIEPNRRHPSVRCLFLGQILYRHAYEFPFVFAQSAKSGRTCHMQP
jgi:hypothetical protein